MSSHPSHLNFKECSDCGVKAKSQADLDKHKSLKHFTNMSAEVDSKNPDLWSKTFFSKPTYQYSYTEGCFNSVDNFFSKTKSKLFEKLSIDMGNWVTDIILSVNVCVEIEYLHKNHRIIEIVNFVRDLKTYSNMILVSDIYDKWSAEIYKMVKKQKKKSYKNCSDFKSDILHTQLRIEKWRPVICDYNRQLPDDIKFKDATVEVESKDEFNFKWAIFSALLEITESRHMVKKNALEIKNISEKIIKKGQFEVNFSGIDTPVPLRDMSKFEDNNSNISINVFGYDYNPQIDQSDLTGPLYRCQSLKKFHINLLLIGDVEANSYRYCWIKDMNPLVQPRLGGPKMEFCFYCMKTFHSETKLDNHKKICQGLVVPLKRKNETIEPNEIAKKIKTTRLPVPFIAYANYEVIPSRNGKSKFNAYGFFIKSSFNEELNVMHSYQGEDAASSFIDNLIVFTSRLFKKNVFGTTNDKSSPSKSVCCVCDKVIDVSESNNLIYKPNMKLIGPVHKKECGQYFENNSFIPIFMPSLEDIDMFRKCLQDYCGKLNILRNKINQVTSMSKFLELSGSCCIELRFLDLKNFLYDDIDYTTKAMTFQDFQCLRKVLNDDHKVLLMQDKVIPYHYITDETKLIEKTLPPRKYFDIIDKKAYDMAKDVWTAFCCKSLNDFLMVYLESEILLQVDVFNFLLKNKPHTQMVKNVHYNLTI